MNVNGMAAWPVGWTMFSLHGSGNFTTSMMIPEGVDTYNLLIPITFL